MGKPQYLTQQQVGPRGFIVGSLIGLAAATAGVNALVPSVGIRPWHVFVSAALLYILASLPIQQLSRFRIHGVDWCMGLFVISAIYAEFTNGADLNYGADLISAASPAFYFSGYVAVRYVCRSPQATIQVLKGLVWPAIPVSFLAVVQTLSIGGFPTWILSIASSEGGQSRLDNGSLIRATSLIGHWTGLGAYLCGIIAAALCLRILERKSGGTYSHVAPLSITLAFVGTICTLTF